MPQQLISCPRCGGRSIATTHVAEGADPVHAGAVASWQCRNCGESCDDLVQAAPVFPRLDVAMGTAAIVLTVLTVAGGMLF
jgi:transcription elongation factor Elf1